MLTKISSLFWKWGKYVLKVIISGDLTWYVRGSGKLARSYQPSSVSRRESNQTDARINFSTIPALDERISIVVNLTEKFN